MFGFDTAEKYCSYDFYKPGWSHTDAPTENSIKGFAVIIQILIL